jgi:hypothetical protein
MAKPSIDVTLRRIVVASIINFAANSMGNFELVSVHEGTSETDMIFELYHSMKDMNENDAKRVIITIETLPE